jgi:hypothetical protein
MSNASNAILAFPEYALVKGWQYQLISPIYEQGYLTVGGKEVRKVLNGPLVVLFAAAVVAGSLDAKYTKIRIRLVNVKGQVLALVENTFYEVFETMPSHAAITSNAPFIPSFDEISKSYVWALAPSREYLVARAGEKVEVELIPPQNPVEETGPTTYSYAYTIIYREYDNNFGERV